MDLELAMPRCATNVHQDISGNIMEVFFYEWKEEDCNCKFSRFNLGGNDGGKGDTIMPEKSEGDTIQRGRIQNMWGEGHGGGGQIIQGGRPGNHEPRLQ